MNFRYLSICCQCTICVCVLKVVIENFRGGIYIGYVEVVSIMYVYICRAEIASPGDGLWSSITLWCERYRGPRLKLSAPAKIAISFPC